jgi:serine protease AprX
MNSSSFTRPKRRSYYYLVTLISVQILFLLLLGLPNCTVNQNISMTSQGMEIKQYIGLTQPNYNGLTGEDVTVAILDSGVISHNDVSDHKVLAFKDFVNNKAEVYDDFGHGSFVTGIIAANGRLVGIAPEVNLVILKVIDKHGIATVENLLAAFRWLVNNQDKYNIKIINLSFGINLFEEKDISQLINVLHKNGAVVVVSAGNSGPVEGSILYPGTLPTVLTVGYINNHSTYNIYDDTVALSSSRGSKLSGQMCKPDIVTLGIDINSLDYLEDGYRIDSGSSYSAAIVTGVTALLMQKHPSMSNQDVIGLLKENTRKLYDHGECTQGFGELFFD